MKESPSLVNVFHEIEANGSKRAARIGSYKTRNAPVLEIDDAELAARLHPPKKAAAPVRESGIDAELVVVKIKK